MTSDRPLPRTIAIDGPAASGKSSLGYAIAEEFGYRFLDTGLMYRAFTLAALEAGVPPEAGACAGFGARLDLRLEGAPEARIVVNGEDVGHRLREPEVEANVSLYSALVPVREAMVRLQRQFAARGRTVLAGRDIGTVVLPDAPLKLYLEASEEARAHRRSTQSREWGPGQQPDQARRDILGRDAIDSTRKASPLRPADDAIVIDTTNMTLAQVIETAFEQVRCAAV